jgi:hypothetical protein
MIATRRDHRIPRIGSAPHSLVTGFRQREPVWPPDEIGPPALTGGVLRRRVTAPTVIV